MRVQTEVVRTGRPPRTWTLRWKTATMPAWAFWYYETEAEARAEAEALNSERIQP